MRAFIVLCCLATAYAASVGYEYERQSGGSVAGFGGDQGFSGGSNGGGSFGSSIGGGSFDGSNGGGSIGGSSFGGSVGGGSLGGSSFGGNNGGSLGGNSFGGSVGGGSLGGNSFGGSVGGGSLGGSSFGGNNGGSGSFGVGPAGGSSGFGAPAEFTKEFYSYTAPEGAFDDNSGNNQLGNSLKRGVRVIFIKGPENSGLENAALQLAKNSAGERTAIYVLNKQADIGDLANKLNNLNNGANSKPEVHFVKYRTPADAENAQRVIKSQYDSLGGKSNNYNGGVAPVLDFASKIPAGSSYQGLESGSSYLPPNKRV